MPDPRPCVSAACLLLTAGVLAACSSDADTRVGQLPDLPDVVDTADTGAAFDAVNQTGRVGSMHMVQLRPTAEHENTVHAFVGLFVGQDDGVVNLAECALLFGGGACVKGLPGEGETRNESADQGFLVTTTWFDADVLNFGDLKVAPSYDIDIPYYEQQPIAFGGSTRVSYDGQLAPYDGPDVISWAGPMAVTAPPPRQRIAVDLDQTIDFAWTPGGAGDVYLRIRDSLTRLPDNGAYTLTVDASIGLRQPIDSAIAKFSRVVRNEVDGAGNDLTVSTASEQWYYLDYENFDGWDELTEGDQLADRCNGAFPLPPLREGQYWADLGAFSSDHDLGVNNALTGNATPGRDAVARVQVDGGETLSLTYRLQRGEAAVYLLTHDCDEATALAADDQPSFDDNIVLNWTPKEDTEAFVVLDSLDDGDSLLALEVQVF